MSAKVLLLRAPIRADRTCFCGRYYELVPTGSLYLEDEDLIGGWHFQCVCNLPIFAPNRPVSWFVADILARKRAGERT